MEKSQQAGMLWAQVELSESHYTIHFHNFRGREQERGKKETGSVSSSQRPPKLLLSYVTLSCLQV